MAKKVRTKSEAKRKNNRETFLFFLLGVAGVVIGVPLAMANHVDVEGGNNLLALIGIALAFFGVFFIFTTPFIWIWERQRIAKAYCPKCGMGYNYGSDVSWEVDETEVDPGHGVSSSTTSRYIKAKANVEFTCRCHECGHEREYTRKFTTGEYDRETGKLQNYNLEKEIKRIFR